MKVIGIILLSIIGTISMLALCGCAQWSFIYLIRCRFLKLEVNHVYYALSRKNDIKAAIIAVLTLAVTAVLLIFGLPFVIEHISELPIPELS